MTWPGDFDRLLVTDIDGTFVGDDSAMTELWNALDQAGIGLVFATGRHVADVDDLLRRLDVPRRALAYICMVGTEIWLSAGNHAFLPDPEWARMIRVSWDGQGVRSAAATVGGLELQEPQFQSSVKCSWYVVDDAESTVVALGEALKARGLESSIVFSGGRHVDVIPKGAGKGAAASYLVRRWGIDPADVVTAGDSGNDLDMMRPEFGFQSIIVGNAQPELLSEAGPETMRVSKHYARGVGEGLVEIGWLPEDYGSH